VQHPGLSDRRWLRFHELAYAAFRLGQTTICAQLTEDGDERSRLEMAGEGYRTTLVALLDDVTAAAAPPASRCG
jgi:hypothetical protein